MRILIVGAGLYGAVMARQFMDDGHEVHVWEKRSHIAGNCYTEKMHGIDVHMYGPHIFHTSVKEVWEYVNRFDEFEQFHMSAQACYQDKLYSFPLNLQTFKELWGVTTPLQAKLRLVQECCLDEVDDPKNAEEWLLSNVGPRIYKMFFKSYIQKQWGKHPVDLPPFIVKRLPIKLSFDNSYYNDRWVAIPKSGYTQFIKNMFHGAKIYLKKTFLKSKEIEKEFDKIVYSGQLDEFFDFQFGELEWRSLRFEHEVLEARDIQGIAMITYPESKYEYTRKIEHKHFLRSQEALQYSVITTEYPQDWDRSKIAYYPINTEQNIQRANKYSSLAKNNNKYIFGGRLGTYQYLDMDKVIKLALNHYKNK